MQKYKCDIFVLCCVNIFPQRIQQTQAKVLVFAVQCFSIQNCSRNCLIFHMLMLHTMISGMLQGIYEYTDVQKIYLFQVVIDFCGQMNNLNTIKETFVNSAGISSIFISFKEPEYRTWYSDWLRAGQPRDQSQSKGRAKNFLFFMLFRPVLGPTQPPK